MSHRKSEQHYKRHLSHFEERDLANRIVLDFSLYCKNNGEKVWHPETEQIIEEKLSQSFEGGIPRFAVAHEYGDVLNRFGH
jgi:hypothetical protein